MYNTTILYDLAKLHQRDIDKEILLIQIAKEAQAARPGLMKRFTLMSESLLKKVSEWLNREKLSPDEHLFFNPLYD
jgi:hypothetical protein